MERHTERHTVANKNFWLIHTIRPLLSVHTLQWQIPMYIYLLWIPILTCDCLWYSHPYFSAQQFFSWFLEYRSFFIVEIENACLGFVPIAWGCKISHLNNVETTKILMMVKTSEFSSPVEERTWGDKGSPNPCDLQQQLGIFWKLHSLLIGGSISGGGDCSKDEPFFCPQMTDAQCCRDCPTVYTLTYNGKSGPPADFCPKSCGECWLAGLGVNGWFSLVFLPKWCLIH